LVVAALAPTRLWAPAESTTFAAEEGAPVTGTYVPGAASVGALARAALRLPAGSVVGALAPAPLKAPSGSTASAAEVASVVGI
jgi:hypothetical protein